MRCLLLDGHNILKVQFTMGLPLLLCSKHDNMHVQCYEGDSSMCQDGSEGKRQSYLCDNSNCYNTELTPAVPDSRFVNVKYTMQ
jgi:hypothetical protein